jgi:hypothetical protein
MKRSALRVEINTLKRMHLCILTIVLDENLFFTRFIFSDSFDIIILHREKFLKSFILFLKNIKCIFLHTNSAIKKSMNDFRNFSLCKSNKIDLEFSYLGEKI